MSILPPIHIGTYIFTIVDISHIRTTLINFFGSIEAYQNPNSFKIQVFK